MNHTINATPPQTLLSPRFCNEPHRSHVLCVKAELGTTHTSWSQHHFVAIGNPERHVQQATIEIVRRNLSYYCLLAPRIYIVVLRAHPVRDESHIQRNATGEVATLYTQCVCSSHEFTGNVNFVRTIINFSVGLMPGSAGVLMKKTLSKLGNVHVFATFVHFM